MRLLRLSVATHRLIHHAIVRMARLARPARLMLVILAVVAVPAKAATISWINPAGGDFLDAANWDAPSAPGATDFAYFGTGGTVTFPFSDACCSPTVITNEAAVIAAGSRIFDLNGSTYDLTTSVAGLSSLEVRGGSLTLQTVGTYQSKDTPDSKVTAVDTTIGRNVGDSATLTVTDFAELINSGGITVGRAGTGTLNIKDDPYIGAGVPPGQPDGPGNVTSNWGVIGDEATGVGTVNVTGEAANSATSWTTTNSTTVGRDGTGYLNITGGGNAYSGRGNIGSGATGVGTVLVEGSGSRWEINTDGPTTNGDLSVGFYGDGTLAITNGADVDVTGGLVFIGEQAGSVGTIMLEGTHNGSTGGSEASLNVTNDIFIGLGGEGNLIIGDSTLGDPEGGGGRVRNRDAYIGRYAGSTGLAKVIGGNSEWESRDLYVGFNALGTAGNTGGDATLEVWGGLVDVTGVLELRGTANLHGGLLRVSQLADGTEGTMNLLGGDLEITNGNLLIGPGGQILNVATDDSAIAVSGRLEVGENGAATMSVDNFPLYDVSIGGEATIHADGVLDMKSGNLIVADQLSVAGRVDLRQHGVLEVADINLFGQGGTLQQLGGTLRLTNTDLYIDEDSEQFGNQFVMDDMDIEMADANANGINVVVGGETDGSLTINGHSSLVPAQDGPSWQNVYELGITIGEDESVGTITMNDSAYMRSHQLTVGGLGTGTLNVQGSAWARTDSSAVVGSEGTGSVNISSNGATWGVAGDLTVGDLGTGTVTVTNGGGLTSGNTYIGQNDGGTGTVTIQGKDGTDASSWTASGDVYVGRYDGGDGTLNVQAGASVTTANVHVGNASGSIGRATIDGAGSNWQVNGDFQIGRFDNSDGTVNVNAGGSISTTGDLYAGNDGVGRLTVDGESGDGTASSVTIDNQLYVGGLNGEGHLTISNGGMLSASASTLASQASTVTKVTVDGTRSDGTASTWDTTGSLQIGNAIGSEIEVDILNGGLVSSAGSSTGSGKDSTTRVKVDGTSADDVASTWSAGGLVIFSLSEGSNSTLDVQNGGLVTAGTVDTGIGQDSVTTINVAGPDSALTASGPIRIGQGTGVQSTVSVTGGGVISADDMIVGNNALAQSSDVDVDGAPAAETPSTIGLSGDLTVGRGSTGTLDITEGGLVTGDGGAGDDVFLGAQAGGHGIVTLGSLVVPQSRLENFDNLYIGGDDVGGQGTGILNVNYAGVVDVNNIQVWGTIDTAINLDGGTINTGNFEAAAGTLNFTDGNLNVSGGIFDDGETHLVLDGLVPHLTLQDGATATTGNATIGNLQRGELTIRSGGSMSSAEGAIGRFNDASELASKVLVKREIGDPVTEWTLAEDLVVGWGGEGRLDVEAGTVTSDRGIVGRSNTGEGEVFVGGDGPSYQGLWDVAGELRVGDTGVGDLTVNDDGRVEAAQINIGYTPQGGGNDGDVWVTGRSAELEATGDLVVGWNGTGDLQVNKGNVISDRGIVGRNTSGTGTVTMTGDVASRGTWTLADELRVADEGTGTLTLNSDSRVTADAITIGRLAGSDGDVTVQSYRADLTATGALIIGDAGTGDLLIDGNTVTGDATVTAGSANLQGASVTLGNADGGQGTVTVQGDRGRLTTAGWLFIGSEGTGDLTVNSGAEVSAGDVVQLGASGTGDGSLTVQGQDARFTGTGVLIVGGVGAADMTVQGGGAVSTASGQVGQLSLGAETATVTIGRADGTDTRESSWTTSGSVYVGGSNSGATGKGVLNINNNGLLDVGQDLRIWGAFGSEATLDGGSIKAGSLTATSGNFNFLDGTVTIDGGSFDDGNSNLVLGDTNGQGASVLVLKNGATLASANTVTVGSVSDARLELRGAGNTSLGVTLGEFGGRTGELVVEDTQLELTGLTVGLQGIGDVHVHGTSTITSGPVQIAAALDSRGDVLIEGPNASWTSSSSWDVGAQESTGTATVRDGAVVTSERLSIRGEGSSVAVDGAQWTNSQVQVSGGLGQNMGSLELLNGATMDTQGEVDVVYSDVTVDGSTWTIERSLDLTTGSDTTTMDITNGATVSVGHHLMMSKLNAGAANSTLTVGGGTGTSSLDVTFDMVVGGTQQNDGGPAELIVEDGGDVTVGHRLRVWDALTMNGGQMDAHELHQGNNATITLAGGVVTVDEYFGDEFVIEGGELRPGNSPGTTIINADYEMYSAASLEIELLGTTAGTGYDQLIVNGTVDLDADSLGGGILDLILLPGFSGEVSDIFTILDNDGSADPINGTFLGLAEGASIMEVVNNYTFGFDISYLGGDGNDIILSLTSKEAVVPLPPAVWLFGSALGLLGWLKRKGV